MSGKIKNKGKLTLTIVAINVIVHLINVAAGGGSYLWLFLSGGGYGKEYGEVAFQAVVEEYEWWRLLTCGYLHLGIFHLAANVYAMVIVVDKLERCLGAVKACIFYNVGIMVTAFVWCLLFKNGSCVGASMGIFVVIGMLLVLSRRSKPEGVQLPKGYRNYLFWYIIIGNLLGIGTLVVHAIGFSVGVVFGWLCTRRNIKR